MNSYLKLMTKWSLALALMVLAIGLVGCGGYGGAGGPRVNPDAGTTKPAPPSPDLLRSGDKLTIAYADIPGAMEPHEETIREDGTITLPLIGTVTAAGKTAGALQQEIHTLYVPKYYRRLTVTVKTESRFYSVQGDVKNPSLQPYIGEMTVLKAIASAGDFTDFANKTKVKLRRTNGQEFIVDCERAMRDSSLDLPVYAGDQIFVPRRLL